MHEREIDGVRVYLALVRNVPLIPQGVHSASNPTAAETQTVGQCRFVLGPRVQIAVYIGPGVVLARRYLLEALDERLHELAGRRSFQCLRRKISPYLDEVGRHLVCEFAAE